MNQLIPYREAIEGIADENFVIVDGRKIHVEQSGEGEPLVMLHGFAASTYEFRKVIPALSKRYRVIAIDLNGFGLTERPESRRSYTPEGQLLMVDDVLNQLGIDHFHLLGHSFGGTLSLFYAAENPESVRNLILISPVAKLQKPPVLLRFAMGRKIAYGMSRLLLSSPHAFRKAQANAYFQKDKLTRGDARIYRERLLIDGFSFAFKGFSESMAEGADVEIPLSRIVVPTVVIAGRHDQIVSLADCESTVSEIRNAEFVIMENSGHSSPEEEPAKVVETIFDFLHQSK